MKPVFSLSTNIPAGSFKRAWPTGPSRFPAKFPSHRVTDAEDVIVLISEFPVSATYKSPVESNETYCGLLNSASVPTASLNPITPLPE